MVKRWLVMFALLPLFSVVEARSIDNTWAYGGRGGGAGYRGNVGVDRAAYDSGLRRGYNDGAYNAGGSTELIEGATPAEEEPTQGVVETPGYNDPYKSNDSIDPSYDTD